jgi:hypothetical protein
VEYDATFFHMFCHCIEINCLVFITSITKVWIALVILNLFKHFCIELVKNNELFAQCCISKQLIVRCEMLYGLLAVEL